MWLGSSWFTSPGVYRVHRLSPQTSKLIKLIKLLNKDVSFVFLKMNRFLWQKGGLKAQSIVAQGNALG